MKTTFPRNILNHFILSAIFSLVLVTGVFAAAIVDNGFIPVVSKPFNSSQSLRSLAQPDGKVIVWGTDFVSGTLIPGRLARLNVDGSLDQTFSYCECPGLTSIDSIRLQLDGKLIVAGQQGTGGQVIRLNSDGSIDPSFNGYLGGSFGNARIWDVLSDGRLLVELVQISGGTTYRTLFRLTTTGAKDPTFPSSGVSVGGGSFSQMGVTNLIGSTDGKIYVLNSMVTFGGVTSSISRRNADGTVDASFEAPSFAGGLSQQLTDIALQPDGKLLVSGFFATVNGVSRPTVVRLHPAGNVDMTFLGPGLPSPGGLSVLPDGKIYFISTGSTAGGAGEYRLNSDGTVDATFVGDPNLSPSSYKVSIDGAGRIVYFGFGQQNFNVYRLTTIGSNDLSFDSKVRDLASVSVVARQPDGKYVVAGEFDRVNDVSRTSIARIAADGSIDQSFDGGTGFNAPPREMITQPDGKILAVGNFTTFNGASVPRLIRLNSIGTRDLGFNVTTDQEISDIELQPDGSILIGGSFNTVNGSPKAKIAKLVSDGSLDPTFNPNIGSGSIYGVVRQSDGKLMVGGSFTGVDGFNRSNLVRLNTNGSLDQSFNAPSITSVNRILPQTDGKYLLVTGDFWGTQMARRNADGTSDGTFAAPQFTFNGSTGNQRILDVKLGPDGSIIVGGFFQGVGTDARNNLVRLKGDGKLDRLFLPYGAQGEVRDLEVDPDGKVIAVGAFSRINASLRTGVARIIPGIVTNPTPFDFDGDGRADVSVFRPSEGRWYILQSADLTLRQVNFAIAGDIPVPADFDGDGRTDVAIYRPSNGDWWSLSSISGQQVNGSFGQTGGIPLPSDFNADGRVDYTVFRPATNTWNRINAVNGQVSVINFGSSGDKPLIGDFNGDGATDCAIYRPSDGNWWWLNSSDGIQRATKWGLAEDRPVPADYTGDGRTDFAVFRPSTGVWYIYDLANNSSIIYPFGANGDRPMGADFDGDGRADTSVFRPSDGIWYLLRSTSGYTGYQWGIATDAAVPNVYVPQ